MRKKLQQRAAISALSLFIDLENGAPIKSHTLGKISNWVITPCCGRPYSSTVQPETPSALAQGLPYRLDAA